MYTQSALSAETGQKKRRRRQLLGLVSAVLVAALGVGGWLLWGAGGGSAASGDKAQDARGQGRLDVRQTVEKRPAATAGAMAFRFSEDGMVPGERTEMPGMWATDKILAKGINRTVAGYRLGTDAAVGDEAWKLRLGGPICGTTQHVNGENRTAVLFRASEEKDALCNHVAFVDLDQGQKVWEAEFPVSELGVGDGTPEDSTFQDQPGITLARATVVVTWGGGTDAYDMDRGTLRWRVKSPASDVCEHNGAAGGTAVLVRLSCWTDPEATSGSFDSITYKVRKLDLQTGATKWTYSVAKGVREIRLLSSDPAVIATAAGEVGITDLISLDEKGKYRTTIRLGSGGYVVECKDEVDFLAAEDCPTMVVGAGQVFVMSKEQGTLVNNSNWIVGFDLTSGNTVKKFESGRNALIRPLRMSGDQLLALRESSDHISPNGLVSLDPNTGEETPYLYFDLPSEGWPLTSAELSDIVVQNGRIFFGSRAAEGPTEGKAWIWLVVGIESDTVKKP
ncbi:hypothetical protein StrepF001_28925 [Streptomyces sp. F001]|nr:hypothetical protein StrepF001_28925 [Streptomyces sp. F001]